MIQNQLNETNKVDKKIVSLTWNRKLILRNRIHKITTLTEKNYWADNSYYSDLEVTIYGQQFDY